MAAYTFAPALLLAALFVAILRLRKRRNVNYPPGPPPHPLIGHLLQVPKLKVWRYFEELGKEYGPIVKLSLAGDEMIILNDPADAEELLNKRSSNYSSRKPLIYAGKYQSQNKRLVLLPYGEELKKQRAAFHRMLQPKVVGTYEHMQELESTQLLIDLLSLTPTPTTPTGPSIDLACKRYAAALVYTLAYGRRISEPELKAVLAGLEAFIADCYPGAHFVDSFPVLDRVPDWVLRVCGVGWREEARGKHGKDMELYMTLLEDVKRRVNAGTQHMDCFASRLWEEKDKLEIDLVSMAYVAGSAFEAGTDTTAGTLLWFLMAIVLHPHVLTRAQAELDSLLGADGETIPSFAHIDELPYCVAVMKEVFRWMPAAPGGFPHLSDADDVYKGYTIHGGTMVIPNIWAMQHNPAQFPDPLVFNPDRFLPSPSTHPDHQSQSRPSVKPETLSEGHYGFGFGRRACPGKHLASKTIWIGVTRMMWAFEIGYKVDERGERVGVVDTERCTSGITSKPEPFEVEIKPRSEKHVRTIRREWARYMEAIGSAS